jgi:hypothetical protein
MSFAKYLICFLSVLLIVGCASGPRKGIGVVRKYELYEDKETLVMLDDTVRRRLYVVDQSASWTDEVM